MLQYFTCRQPFVLESGQVLQELTIAYTISGKLNADQSNVVWICHALTANADPQDWWNGLVGAGKIISPETHFIVCANILGSCYGSTGPLSIDPGTGSPYYGRFPPITIRDMVKAHCWLRAHLGIKHIALLGGGSMGGYQALEWALLEPERIGKLFLLATGASESAWGIAVHTAQRLAIEADATWLEEREQAGCKGLKAARAIGMLTYRNYQLFVQQQTDPDTEKTDDFRASGYIRYQGEKLVRRFNAYSYWFLSKAMDSHHIARGRGGNIEAVLATIHQPTLVIGISSDILCPPEEQVRLAKHLPYSHYVCIDSPYGHDGFLVESEQISAALKSWWN